MRKRAGETPAPRRVFRLKFLRTPQRDVDDLCRRVDAEWEPVADAVGDEQLGAASHVEAGPVAVHQRAESDPWREHELTTMRVTGEGEWDVRFRGEIEGVRVMR